MQNKIKIIIALVSLAFIGLIIGWILMGSALAKTRAQRDTALNERDSARLSEGLGWLFTAEKAAGRYPDSLLYAAKAIGFRNQGGDDDPRAIPLIEKTRNASEFDKVEEWLNTQQSFRPVWSGDLGSPISGLAVSAQGRYLFATCDKTAKRWDFSQPDSALELPGTSALTTRPDGKTFATIGPETVVYQEDGTELKRYKESSTAIAYNISGDTLALARPNGIIALPGDETSVLGNAGGKVSQLAFSPDDATLAALVPEVGVRLWFHHQKTTHQAWADHSDQSTAIAYHPDPDSGRIAIGSEDGSISIWRIFDGKKLAQIEAPTFHNGAINSLSYSADGNYLASAGADELIQLWNTEGATPKLMAKLSGHVGEVSDVAFLPGGDLIASVGQDGTAKLWDIRQDISVRDLYRYIKEDWYEFDENSRSVIWKNGNGFLDLPTDSTVAAWQSGDTSSLGKKFLASGNLIAAGLVSSDLDPIDKALSSQVDSAIANRNWHLARLRSRQMENLGLGKKVISTPFANSKDFTNGLGAEMIWCKPGNFFMGEPDGPDFARRHEVKLSKGFWLGQHEVTQAMWEAVMGTNPSINRDAGSQAPAENFNWHQAAEFCQKLTGLERGRGSIPAGWEYQMPTEAQWEYACRAGSQSTWAFGDNSSKLHKNGNFDDKAGGLSDEADLDQDDGFKYTSPVGSYAANAWKLMDMHGNVFEWCRDAMDPTNPDYPDGPVTDPESTTGGLRVIRGGGYDATSAECRSAYRDANSPLVPSANLGLRVALIPVAE